MINHARTLFLNVPGLPEGAATEYGEEYVPPDFRPLALPAYLTHLRRFLFGARPDRAFSNYRARQLLVPLHRTELSPYLLYLDPRVTYDPSNLQPLPTGWAVTPGAVLSGAVAPPDVSGRMSYAFRLSPTETGVVAEEFRPDSRSEEMAASGDWDLTDPVDLWDTGLAVRLPTGAEPIVIEATTGLDTLELADLDELDLEELDMLLAGPGSPAETSWAPALDTLTLAQLDTLGLGGLDAMPLLPRSPSLTVEIQGYATPAKTAGKLIAELRTGGAGYLTQLFGQVEPYQSFGRIWTSHPTPMVQLGGLLLAIIYRTEEIRRYG